jgi:hypothetical protein
MAMRIGPASRIYEIPNFSTLSRSKQLKITRHKCKPLQCYTDECAASCVEPHHGPARRDVLASLLLGQVLFAPSKIEAAVVEEDVAERVFASAGTTERNRLNNDCIGPDE